MPAPAAHDSTLIPVTASCHQRSYRTGKCKFRQQLSPLMQVKVRRLYIRNHHPNRHRRRQDRNRHRQRTAATPGSCVRNAVIRQDR